MKIFGNKVYFDIDTSDLINIKLRVPRFAVLTCGVILLLIVLIFVIQIVSEPTAPPENLLVSNQTDSKLSVLYTTAKPTLGYVLISKYEWKLKIPYFNRFLVARELDDDFVASKNHYTTIKGLTPNTKYYYAVSTGWHTYSLDVDGKNLPEAKTLESLQTDPGLPNPAYGKILRADKTPASKVMIYFIGKNKTISTVTDALGRWNMDLSQVDFGPEIQAVVLDGKVAGRVVLNTAIMQPALTIILK